MKLEVEQIRQALRARTPRQWSGEPVGKHAAVATILRQQGNDVDVLFIRRAERMGDPWSGHMAFPGGHVEPSDSDLLETAQRETLEEVGVDLRHHEFLGRLDDLGATARGKFTGMVVAPHVFLLRGDATLQLNHEVAEVVWGPLGAMVRGEVDASKHLVHEGTSLTLPAYSVSGHVVWGMTHRMLQSFFEALRVQQAVHVAAGVRAP